MHLPGRPGQQQLGRSELAAVPQTYAAVWKIDAEEDRVPRAVLVGMLRGANRGR